MTGEYLKVLNGQIVGCCALGGAFLAVRPEMASLQHTDDFGLTMDDQSEIRLELISRFPVLATNIHNEAFLNAVEKKTGSLREYFVDKTDLSLHHVIANSVDNSNATAEDMHSVLNMFADQLVAA